MGTSLRKFAFGYISSNSVSEIGLHEMYHA